MGYTTDFYEGKNHQLDLRYQKQKRSTKHSLGYFIQEETYKDQSIAEKSLSINELYYLLNHQFINHVVEFGLRGSSNRYFGDHLLYQAGFRKNFHNQKYISLNTKTAYKAPSLYQQRAPETGFGPVGNEDLAPEKSHYIELSYGKVNPTHAWEAALFYNEVDSFIDFENGYENLYKVIYKGVELTQSFKNKKHSFNSGLTLLHFSKVGEREIQKRPNFSLKSTYGNKISDQQEIQFAWSWKGRRFEYIDGEREELKAFDTLDISHVWSKGDIQFKSSLNNAFDRDYELVQGYATLGRTLHFELKYLY